jgi:hypothetical protein
LGEGVEIHRCRYGAAPTCYRARLGTWKMDTARHICNTSKFNGTVEHAATLSGKSWKSSLV